MAILNLCIYSRQVKLMMKNVASWNFWKMLVLSPSTNANKRTSQLLLSKKTDLACMPITLTNSYVHTTWISKSTQWQSLQTSERTFTLCRMYVKHTITPVHIYYSASSALSGSRAQTLVGNRASPIESCALPVLQRKTGEGSETHTLTQPTFPFCFSPLNSSLYAGRA